MHARTDAHTCLYTNHNTQDLHEYRDATLVLVFSIITTLQLRFFSPESTDDDYRGLSQGTYSEQPQDVLPDAWTNLLFFVTAAIIVLQIGFPT